MKRRIENAKKLPEKVLWKGESEQQQPQCCPQAQCSGSQTLHSDGTKSGPSADYQ